MAQKKHQKLELTWIGKGEEPKLEPRILVENPEYSYGEPNTDNILIHGDNLLALKALEQDYAGKINVFILTHLIILVQRLNIMMTIPNTQSG
jgi:adenine-specific DNA-methyltransferase